jgi:phosphate/phosphite/phosphonate ABC transporter binding protein
MSDRLTFGYFAQEETTREASERLREWMAERLGCPLELSYSGGYEALAKDLEAENVDCAWLPPVAYVKVPAAHVEPLLALERGRRTGYQSALVVRADSPIERVEQLRNARAAWVDAWSASGFVVPRVGLKRLGIDPRNLFRVEAFHGSHSAALRAVLDGAADVTGTHARPKASGEEGFEGSWTLVEGKAMRVLRTFGDVPSDLIAVRPGLSAEKKQSLSNVFKEAATAKSAEIKAIFGADRFADVPSRRGYDDLRTSLEDANRAGLFD